MANFGYALPETGTDAELLALCRQLQAKILSSFESYSVAEMQGARTKLKELREYEKDLIASIAAESGTDSKTNYAIRGQSL